MQGRLNFSSENTHERYEVYVNGDFVGYKILSKQNEELVDLEDFLHKQGFSEAKAHIDKSHYEIKTDKDSAERIKKVLEMYLQQR
ncbi:hypothetical protein [Anoxybacteroides tepidamans]|uniref:hypothetical protein n=1 Tax=Anoxybacteroides tepidamans TaxID=265948 RepID=UPI0004835CAE|nr:hypothetical protein [Anoxybacillus tepidamans]